MLVKNRNTSLFHNFVHIGHQTIKRVPIQSSRSGLWLGAPFDQEQLGTMTTLAQKGIRELIDLQQKARRASGP